MIGIEVVDELSPEQGVSSGLGEKNACSKKQRGQAVFDFNCEGLFRAYYEVDEKTGEEKPKAMVFREDY
jgi:hypothetical protein